MMLTCVGIVWMLMICAVEFEIYQQGSFSVGLYFYTSCCLLGVAQKLHGLPMVFSVIFISLRLTQLRESMGMVLGVFCL